MNTEQAITVVSMQPNEQLFKRIIDYMEFSNPEPMLTSGGLNPDVRNVKGVDCLFYGKSKTQKILFKLIDHEVGKYIFLHKAKFKELELKKIQSISLLKYEVGGKYEVHTDSSFRWHREVTCIINLNEDYEGGEFVFYHPNAKDVIKEVKTKKAQMIFFPSNCMFPHAVKPIKSGIRYSIVLWLV